MTAATMMLQRNHGRAHIEPGSQCLGARAATALLPMRPTTEIAVRRVACGSAAEAMGASPIAALPSRMGKAQQAARANADAIPPATRATAPLDFRPSFILPD